jgi:hypothetical protein
MRFLATIIAVIISASYSFAQTKETKEAQKYHKESEDIRKQVWSWDMPQFKVRNVPAQYTNSSKVVLARHTEITAASKSRLIYYGISFASKKEENLTEIFRELVKLNDKNAVADYSELTFTQFAKGSGFYSSDKTTMYVGVRILKPNGTIKEVNADDIVLTKDEPNEKKAKLAVPDLAPGDILDYFIASERETGFDYSSRPYEVYFFDEAPILSLSFHAQLGKKFAVEYRSYNGAPELKVAKNDDKEIIIDVEKNNIPPFETSLWVSPPRELPHIRMYISLGYSGPGRKFNDTNKPGEVIKSDGGDAALDDKAKGLSWQYYSGYLVKGAKRPYDDIESRAKSRAKQMGLSYKDMSDVDKATLLYYSVRYELMEFWVDALSRRIDIGSREFAGRPFEFFCTLKAAGLDPAILVCDSRVGYRFNEAMRGDDLDAAVCLPANKMFFYLGSIYDVPFESPVNLEGIKDTRIFTFDHPSIIASANKASSLTNIALGFNVPVSTVEKNARIENLALSLTPDKSAIAVKRSTTLKGYYKADEQKNLILYEDLYESERKAFHEEKSLIETLEGDKRERKYVDEVKNAFAEARKKQKDAFIKEAKDWFEGDITDLKDYKTDSLGIRHTSPNFVYSSSFTLGGLVKKAGNNIIVEIGKMQGSPLAVKEDQRKRDIDVYAPFARSIQYNMQLEIPDGYAVEGVAALNTKVENETGSFVVEASNTDKLVTIKVTKKYAHNFEPSSNFAKMIQFTDASVNWLNSKLLLKKVK